MTAFSRIVRRITSNRYPVRQFAQKTCKSLCNLTIDFQQILVYNMYVR